MAHPRLDGIIPPITTPFNGDAVAYDHLAENVNKWSKTGIIGFLVFGSTGEYIYLTEEEKVQMIKTVVEVAPKGMTIIAGSGCESTAATIRLTIACAEKGAQAALVVTPCYYGTKMTGEALVAHFTAVADAVPIPIMLYNVPQYTHVNMGVDTIAQLSNHPNIIGIKDSLGNVAQLGAILNNTAPGFKTLTGAGGAVFNALTLGCCGAILALANVAPAGCVNIYDLIKQGKIDEARDLQLRLLPVNTAATVTYGIPGAKYMLDRLGYHGGPPRPPLLPVNDAEKEKIDAILTTAGLL
jgi:4-hydroxy-2-oxoglutarate aldolase